MSSPVYDCNERLELKSYLVLAKVCLGTCSINLPHDHFDSIGGIEAPLGKVNTVRFLEDFTYFEKIFGDLNLVGGEVYDLLPVLLRVE